MSDRTKKVVVSVLAVLVAAATALGYQDLVQAVCQ